MKNASPAAQTGEGVRFGIVVLQEEGAEETAKQLLVLRREEKIALYLIIHRGKIADAILATGFSLISRSSESLTSNGKWS